MMKSSLLVATAVLATSLPAFADTATDHYYLGASATLGADTSVDWIASGGGLSGGYRLDDTLWLRGRVDVAARVGYGTTNDISFHSPQQQHVDALVGLETRRCWSASGCFVAGADAGVRGPDSRLGAGFEVVPRLGLDLGDEHLRVRPALEAKVAWIGGYDTELGGVLPAFGIGASLGLAYVW